ncbi:hypothetical protein SAMN05216475_1858 [Pseudomonas synxantha]|uniref:Threonine synthase n=1 Tax=Pseudomonas synxantha TaxID=47883 RepID=A0AAX3I772_9PSED|nr:hypothetical protein [Pseudomonas synxantha]SDU23492.1 hypothetical protein SAMN05216475_1858 [Pseudomonas synxantha]VTQ98522.1 Uncharacterised protein [Pseudomonas synxantha]
MGEGACPNAGSASINVYWADAFARKPPPTFDQQCNGYSAQIRLKVPVFLRMFCRVSCTSAISAAAVV